jgi:hypothetical protein
MLPQLTIFLKSVGSKPQEVIHCISQLRGVSLPEAERLIKQGDVLLGQGELNQVGAIALEVCQLGGEIELRPLRDAPLSEATPEEMYWELQRRTGLTFAFAFKEVGEC